jgi:hypothetical protein
MEHVRPQSGQETGHGPSLGSISAAGKGQGEEFGPVSLQGTAEGMILGCRIQDSCHRHLMAPHGMSRGQGSHYGLQAADPGRSE